jgi:hypothetical protein
MKKKYYITYYNDECWNGFVRIYRSKLSLDEVLRRIIRKHCPMSLEEDDPKFLSKLDKKGLLNFLSGTGSDGGDYILSIIDGNGNLIYKVS